ncbi:hypothetical protein EsH8_XV_000006 [Colletotrichum jinshuiense]
MLENHRMGAAIKHLRRTALDGDEAYTAHPQQHPNRVFSHPTHPSHGDNDDDDDGGDNNHDDDDGDNNDSHHVSTPPSHIAAAFGNLSAVRWLIVHHATAPAAVPHDPINPLATFAPDGCPASTPLHIALCHGHIETAKFLITQGANWSHSVPGSHGVTGLMIISANGLVPLLDWLPTRVAVTARDVNRRDDAGLAALKYAALNDDGWLAAVARPPPSLQTTSHHARSDSAVSSDPTVAAIITKIQAMGHLPAVNPARLALPDLLADLHLSWWQLVETTAELHPAAPSPSFQTFCCAPSATSPSSASSTPSSQALCPPLAPAPCPPKRTCLTKAISAALTATSGERFSASQVLGAIRAAMYAKHSNPAAVPQPTGIHVTNGLKALQAGQYSLPPPADLPTTTTTATATSVDVSGASSEDLELARSMEELNVEEGLDPLPLDLPFHHMTLPPLTPTSTLPASLADAPMPGFSSSQEDSREETPRGGGPPTVLLTFDRSSGRLVGVEKVGDVEDEAAH